MMNPAPVRKPLVGACWAGVEAPPAIDAFAFEEYELRPGGDRFGVVAPPACERTALQEEGRAYSWPIVQGEPFDVEYEAAEFHPCFQYINISNQACISYPKKRQSLGQPGAEVDHLH